MEEKRKQKDILSSTLARIVAFFVLAISFIVGLTCSFVSAYLMEEDAYTRGITSMIHDRMLSYIWSDVGYVKQLYQQEDIEAIEEYLSVGNVSLEIYDEDTLLWSNYDGAQTKYSFNCYSDVYVTLKGDADLPEQEPLNDAEVPESGEPSEENGVGGRETGLEQVPESGKVSDQDGVGGSTAEPKEVNDGDTDTGVTDHFGASSVTTKELTEERKETTIHKTLTFRLYVDETFPAEDEYKTVYMQGLIIEKYMYLFPVLAVIGIFLFLCSFIFLMCSAGHHRGQEGITGGVLYFFHFDVVTFIFGAAALVMLVFVINVAPYGEWMGLLFGAVLAMAEVVWCTIYCMEFATELKMGTLLKHTLIFSVLSWICRGIKGVWKGLATLVRGLPLLLNTMIIYAGYSIVELFVLIFFRQLWLMDPEIYLLWFMKKVALLPVLLYGALVFKKLQEGSKELAEGNLAYKLNTSKMVLAFKEQGENLNRIGEGISAAVEERMRSERLKTELITNVSHDLKTPLTSIINYADLIGTAVSGTETSDGGKGSTELTVDVGSPEINREQLAEYAEVLLRQSGRLKKLLEDLVEASKAATGNLEVNLIPCEISVLLSQAIGEYEQRFEQKQLELIVRQPAESMNILADGRHVWRVFDNLMNNICKYAQEGTRVYLTVEQKIKEVEIVFRNMSKYPLEISADELKERFVRGDKSRHMEGNGLGLSIAGGLMELQNGQMEIVTDGDLFKVVLRFPLLEK